MAADMSFGMNIEGLDGTSYISMAPWHHGKLFGSMRCTIGKTLGQQLTQRAQILPSLQAKKNRWQKRKGQIRGKKLNKKNSEDSTTLSGQFVQTR